MLGWGVGDQAAAVPMILAPASTELFIPRSTGLNRDLQHLLKPKCVFSRPESP